jgi:hypothetical protein
MQNELPSLAIVRRETEPVPRALRKRRATSSVMVPLAAACLVASALGFDASDIRSRVAPTPPISCWDATVYHFSTTYRVRFEGVEPPPRGSSGRLRRRAATPAGHSQPSGAARLNSRAFLGQPGAPVSGRQLFSAGLPGLVLSNGSFKDRHWAEWNPSSSG